MKPRMRSPLVVLIDSRFARFTNIFGLYFYFWFSKLSFGQFLYGKSKDHCNLVSLTERADIEMVS